VNTTATGVRVENPFPGLRPFEEDDQHLFFGRESQVDTMIDKLAATHFLAVVGTSGSGKSSLVNCGLRPALRRGLMSSAGSSWRMAYVRPGSDPIAALAQSLVQPDGEKPDPDRLFRNPKVAAFDVKEAVEATLRTSRLGLLDSFEQARLDQHTRLLVVADQFEELFRYRNLQTSSGIVQSTEENSVAFVNLLLEAAASQRRIYIVMTMRSDFLGDCAQFFGLPEAINRSQYLVPRMTRDERRSAIEGPVKVAGAEMTPVLSTRLVNDVGDNPDQLSILQHALNRTWAYWQEQGGNGPVDLKHYVAIGTMSEALDRHAEEAFNELKRKEDTHKQAICQKVFQAITDKGSDARGIRRPTRADVLCAIAGIELGELTAVLSPFRDPSRSFVTPQISKKIAPNTVIDISHESLMRIWKRLKQWVNDEATSAAQYQRLADNATRHAQGAAGLMTDPELSLILNWRDNEKPNAFWGDRYRTGFDSAIAFLEESRKARDAAIEAEKERQRAERERERRELEEKQERQRRELQRTRRWLAVAGTLLVLAVVSLLVAVIAKRNAAIAQQKAAAEQQKTAVAETAANANRELANEQAKLAKEQTDAAEKERKLAEVAKAADARAEFERKMVISAVDAGTAAAIGENRQLDLEELLSRDTNEKKDPAIIEQEKAARDSAIAKRRDLQLEAGHKSAEAAALIEDGKVLTPAKISGSDLFDTSVGTIVTNWSGRGTEATGNSGKPACGEVSATTKYPADMLSGSGGSPCRATIFADNQPLGTEHWIEWKTSRPVTVRSIGLFAAHDQVRLKRSFSGFNFYVKKNGKWELVKQFSPRLSPTVIYGGSCGSKPCFPPPAQPYTAGTVLADCINLPSTTGQEFRAGFVQWTSMAERSSGPRVLQLDGYANPDCRK
jgi:hypothetical protein